MVKRIIVVALGVLLIFAFSTSVMAAAKVDFSGTFRVRAFYNNNFTLQGKEAWESKRSYIDQRLRINLKIMPTENLTLNLGLTTEDQVWGQQGTNNFFMRPYGTGGAGVPVPGNFATLGIPVSQRDPQTDFELRYFWADIKTSIGLFSVGRMPFNGFSPRTLGWTGSTVMPSVPGGQLEENALDSIMWMLPLNPVTVGAVYTKKNENDSATGENPLLAANGSRVTNANGRQYDSDWDLYALFGIYKFTYGSVGLAVSLDHTRSQYAGLGAVNQRVAPTPFWVVLPPQVLPYLDPNNNSVDGQMWTFTIPAVLNFGPLGLHAQFQYAVGQVNWHLAPGAPTQVRGANGTIMDIKDKADLANVMFYGDVTYNYGPGLAGLQYVYYSGDKTSTDYSITGGLYSVGSDYTPLLIAYDRGLTLGVDQLLTSADRLGYTMTNVYRGWNHWSLVGWVDHNLTEDIMIHAALGYIDILETGKNRFNNKSIGKHYGTELDVSLLYTLMSNLTWQLDLGYFWSGNYFKQGWDGEEEIRNNAAARAAGLQPSMAKIGNAWAVKSTLTLKF